MNNHDRMNNPLIKDNAVIEILTHGTIFLDDDKTNKIRFQVPNGMNVIHINATAPGVCNYVDEDVADKLTTKIKSYLSAINTKLNLLTPNITEDKLEIIKNGFLHIIKELKIIDKKFTYNKISKKKVITDPDDTEYMNAFDRNYSIHFYKSGETIRNRGYSRTDGEVLNSGSFTDFKINMLTMYGDEDLMVEILQRRPTWPTPSYNSNITLEELLNYLSRENIKNVVIFDFTCSGFTSNNKYLDNQREVRRLRNEFQKEESTHTFPEKNKRIKVNNPTDNSLASSSSAEPPAGGKRFTRKHRKSRKNRKPFRKSRKSRKSFRTVNKKK